MTVFVIMGIAGCGKTTVGTLTADMLKVSFYDADDFHPPLNIAKMSSGVPLAEEDRVSWTDAICKKLVKKAGKETIILACSALSKATRSRLRGGLSGHCQFIHLHGDITTLKRRLKARKDHFFSVDLLASQFSALAMPRRALTLDIKLPPDQLAQKIVAYIKVN